MKAGSYMSRRLDPRVFRQSLPRGRGGKPPMGKMEGKMEFGEGCTREVKGFKATSAKDEHKWMFINGHVRSVRPLYGLMFG